MSTLTVNRNLRDAEIRQATEARRTEDVKIMQKVNAVNREAFTQRMPGQLEHHMRLVSERLGAVLNKAPGVDIASPDSWLATADELDSLTSALWNLEQVRRAWPIEATGD
jgi:hypothetical protein